MCPSASLGSTGTKTPGKNSRLRFGILAQGLFPFRIPERPDVLGKGKGEVDIWGILWGRSHMELHPREFGDWGMAVMEWGWINGFGNSRNSSGAWSWNFGMCQGRRTWIPGFPGSAGKEGIEILLGSALPLPSAPQGKPFNPSPWCSENWAALGFWGWFGIFGAGLGFSELVQIFQG